MRVSREPPPRLQGPARGAGFVADARQSPMLPPWHAHTTGGRAAPARVSSVDLDVRAPHNLAEDRGPEDTPGGGQRVGLCRRRRHHGDGLMPAQPST